ncbi:uncharacterized protein LOC141690582 [Apium graveolens]|uniref:uncharacterized protein LOC141690582 n=1 Tax=Apium graveolens TaxID=4045 RepID=UPI003D797B1B
MNVAEYEAKFTELSRFMPELVNTEEKKVVRLSHLVSEFDSACTFYFKKERFAVDAEQPLFEGSECTKLESMLKLHNWKARFGISDTAFTELLSSVGSILPKDNVLPPNAYEAKKTLSDLGLEYIKIHSCPNNCILYRGIHSDASQCLHCKLSCGKVRKNGQLRVNVPAKRINDDKMRHPTDSPSWRNIDYRWPAFGSESRNIRMDLSVDGINPHTNGLVNRYIYWLVVLVMYNLPPWLCMKRKFMMLSVLVPGPHEPGNNIDVYLQPLIDDLKKLWEEGEPNIYDAYSKSYFTLKAILLWTINDFPAYGNLLGCVNKGYKSCPICGDNTVAKYLSHSRNMCFQGHRRYLPRQHPYRRQKAAFNGQQELGNACQPLSGEEVKVVDVSKLDKLQSDVIITLYNLEKIFPSSFFDVMLHLIVHLVLEVRLCGPVFYRWMYVFERLNKVLKSYVRNRYYPEGCMAESYLKEESVEFCTKFMSQTCTTVGIPVEQGKQSGPLSAAIIKVVEEKERDEAHLHVLQNNDDVYPYIVSIWMKFTEGRKKVFIGSWESTIGYLPIGLKKVNSEMKGNPDAVSETIQWLAGKPSFSVLTYQGFSVNGVQYFMKDRDDARVVQNNGVHVVAKAVQVSSAKDLNPIESDMTFYGIILEVWELDYHEFKAPLFLCKWAENNKGIKIEDLGFTLVDFNRQGHKKDKYISVDQVNQVFYIKDPVDPTWSIVPAMSDPDDVEEYERAHDETLLAEMEIADPAPAAVVDISDDDPD